LNKYSAIAQWYLPAGRRGAVVIHSMDNYYIYIIQSKVDNRLYVGLSKNINKRVKEHNFGQTKSTKGYRPWNLVYFEFVGSRIKARKREKYFKSGCGKEYIKKYLGSKAPR